MSADDSCLQLLVLNIKDDFYALRVGNKGLVEIVDFKKEYTLVRDFSKLFQNFNMKVYDKTLYIINSDNVSQVAYMTSKNLMHVLEDEKVKINVLDFSGIFNSI